jgi:signal peptidase
VTQRIVWVGRDKAGKPSFGTKGDANKGPDPWRFVLHAPVQARVAFHVPYLGYAFAGLSDKRIRMLVIGLPAALIALSVLGGIWRDAGRASDGPATEASETAGSSSP